MAKFGYSGSGGRQPTLGSGKRFSNLKSKLASQPGVRNPGALAAAIGRKKYGKKKMAQLSEEGQGDATGPMDNEVDE